MNDAGKTLCQDARNRVAVVLATYNERANIEKLVPELLSLPLAPTVIIVDDSSPDGTGQAVKNFIAELGGRIELIERPRKMGYGSAFVAGFKQALAGQASVVVSMDADFSHDPQSIPDLVSALSQSDLAIGSRYVGGIRILNWSMKRLLLSSFANNYVNLILGFGVKDCTSGFRAYRAEILRRINFEQTGSQGYAFIVEMLEHVRRAGGTVKEVPIVYTERKEGRSKMSKRVIMEAMLRPFSIKLSRLTR